ncbi:MAG: serine hydrolase domain-containing protein [Parvularculales bacterium]
MSTVTLLAEQTASPEETGLSAERLDRIPQFFSNYINKGKLAGLSILIARDEQVAHLSCQGVKDTTTTDPIKPDTIFRIYSMTKPITSLALMMLFEEGRFLLEHPVSRYIPSFANCRVWKSGTNMIHATEPALREITILDLMTHTSGLTYDFMNWHPVDRLYRRNGITSANPDMTSGEMAERVTEIPLMFQPGTHWNYSIATDMCGRLVEVLSGQTLDEFFSTRIFNPLNMNDTGFMVPEDKLSRFASNYERDPKNKKLRTVDPGSTESPYAHPRKFLSGGGGLVSTITDYYRFCQMMLNGGTLDDTRLISRKTVELMTANHLPNGATLQDIGIGSFTENRFEGTGFGLGFSVVMDPSDARMPGSPGMYSWGGAASTYFWIDPEEELIAILMTQFMPSDYYPLRPQLQQLAYAAIDD